MEELLYQSQPNLLLDFQVKVSLLVEVMIHGQLFLVGLGHVEVICFAMVVTCVLTVPTH